MFCINIGGYQKLRCSSLENYLGFVYLLIIAEKKVEDKIIQEIEAFGYKKNKFKVIEKTAEELIREDRDSK